VDGGTVNLEFHLMASLPIRRNQFKTADFAAWLASNGAEIGIPTNPYEVIRYRAYHAGSNKALTHIVYAKESGLLNFQGASAQHYGLFAAGLSFGREAALSGPSSPRQTPQNAKPAEPSKGVIRRKKLIERDGDECWFCGIPMGADMTIEHLVPKSAGGGNKLANYALAHAKCNHDAADMPLVQKIELRNRLRTTLVKEPGA
jgi:hypothetical protein